MAINFSLNSDGGVVTQQSTLSGGSSNSFSGGSGASGQSSGSVAGGGTDYAALANAYKQQGPLGLGVNIDALNKVTGGMIQGYIDRTKKEQYAEGMAQAAQGRSLIQIENDQPWYTKLYGPDASVQGAQAFNVAASMQEAQSQFMQAMPQLREKSPDQVRKYLVQKMGEVQSTGDPRFDSMVQQGLAEQLPKMLDTHLSQYMQYTQEQNYNGFTNLGTQGGGALQATLKASNNLSEDDVARANADYTNTLARPDNMTAEAYQRGLRDVVLSNAQTGNWAAVRAIKAMPEYAEMNTQMKDSLETQIPKLEEQWALKNPAARNLFTSRADLQYSLQSGQANPDSSPQGHAMLDKIMDGMEDSNRKLNGDATQVYDNKQRAQMHKLLDWGNARRLAQIQAAAKDQLNYDQSVALATQALNSSNTAGLAGIPLAGGAAGQAADAAFAKGVQSQDAEVQDNVFDKLSAVAHEEQFQSPQLKQALTQNLPGLISGNGPATPQMQTALTYAGKLYKGAGGAGAVASYVGSDAPKVIALLNSGIDINDPEQLKQQRELIARGGAATATPADVKAAKDIVTQSDPGWFKKVMPFVGGSGQLTPYNLNDGNKEQLATHVAPIIAQYKTAYHLTDEDASKAAFSQVMKNADFVPGAFILHNAALGQRSFEAAVGAMYPGMGAQHTSNYQNAVQYVIDGEITKAGGDPKAWQVQSGENLGNGYMTLFMTGPSGAMKHINITADAVGKRCLETFGHKPDAQQQDLGLSSKNAWGWSF